MDEGVLLALCVSPIQVANLSRASPVIVDRNRSLNAAAQGAHLHVFHRTLHAVLLRRFVDGLDVIIYFSYAL